MMARTLSAPSASTAMHSVSAESTPPDRPIRACRKAVLAQSSRARPAPAPRTVLPPDGVGHPARPCGRHHRRRTSITCRVHRQCGARQASRPSGGRAQRSPVEHQFILPADQIAVHRRHAGIGHARSPAPDFAALLLVQVPGRGVEHGQNLRAGAGPPSARRVPTRRRRC
jgi:hypothetical protein